MRTTVLNYLHTEHPLTQIEFNELAGKEARLKAEQARRGEAGEAESELEPPRQRASEPLPAPPADDTTEQLEAVRARLAELRAVIKSGFVRLIIKGLNRGEYRQLLVAHPPREDEELDQRTGYNVDTFGDELIQACLIRTETLDGEQLWARPANDSGKHFREQETCPDWPAWADEMTDGQWEEIFVACLKITKDPSPAFPQ